MHTQLFPADKHRSEYYYDMYTLVPGVLPKALCDRVNGVVERLASQKAVQMVQHGGAGTERELDYGGNYRHHILKGEDVRTHLPELVGAYHALVNQISVITGLPIVTSPYRDSDINVKAYPSDGGTIGWHKDTNGITVLIYTTTNTEGALVLEIEREKPWTQTVEKEVKKVYADTGTMLVMQGRKVRHMSEPMRTQRKTVVVFNYYVGGPSGDTWRPKGFDDLVYHGEEVTKDSQPPK